MDKIADNEEPKKDPNLPVKKTPSDENKPYRKRKRQYFNSIREQMEFYFGDANLSKDRFLKQLIDKDPYVPLTVFLTFNKIKALARSVEEIAKALTNSHLLELDETQKRVRRKTALLAERDVDDKTLYVECIPPTADHDWMKQNFARFGAVTYVSLPKYTKSRRIKEFGFVEFEKVESIMKAVKVFKDFQGVLSMQETNPAELESVKAYLKEHQNTDNASSNAALCEDKQGEENQTNKRKTEFDDVHADEETPPAKKAKADEELLASSTATETGEETSTSITEEESEKAKAEKIATTTTTDKNNNNDELSQKKRRRKKKSKKSISKRINLQNNDDGFYNMRILPKRDWKRLRNKYLNIQREQVAELKRKAWKAAQQSRDNFMEINEVTTPAAATKPSEHKFHKINMNFYGAGDAETNEANNNGAACKMKDVKATNIALERAPLFNYEPGLIVEIDFAEPCVTVKEFKADMRQHAAVKYVDVKEGEMHAYLRLESTSAADAFIRQISCAEYKCKLLSGDAELEYWRKIEEDRAMKLTKKVRVPQRRGREKVKKLLSKHIRFGDDDDEIEQSEA